MHQLLLSGEENFQREKGFLVAGRRIGRLEFELGEPLGERFLPGVLGGARQEVDEAGGEQRVHGKAAPVLFQLLELRVKTHW